jgi:hypothetical protein
MPRPTTEERKELLRKRLREYGTEPKAPLGTPYVPPEPKEEPKVEASAPTEEKEEPETKQEESSEPTTPPARKPSSMSISNRVTQQRQNKPTNYKVHVITALALAVAVNTVALGWRAVVGKA